MVAAGFSGVVESIDGTHIKICSPANRHNEYLDRIFKHTVTLLAVCDAKKKDSLGYLQNLLAVFMTRAR